MYFASMQGDLDSIPRLGWPPGEGKGYPLQYSGLENFMDWIVHGVAKGWTQLSDFHFHWISNMNKSSIWLITFAHKNSCKAYLEYYAIGFLDFFTLNCLVTHCEEEVK